MCMSARVCVRAYPRADFSVDGIFEAWYVRNMTSWSANIMCKSGDQNKNVLNENIQPWSRSHSVLV